MKIEPVFMHLKIIFRSYESENLSEFTVALLVELVFIIMKTHNVPMIFSLWLKTGWVQDYRY